MDDRRIVFWSVTGAAVILVFGGIAAIFVAKPNLLQSTSAVGAPAATTQPGAPAQTPAAATPPPLPTTRWSGDAFSIPDVNPALLRIAANSGWASAQVSQLQRALGDAAVKDKTVLSSLTVREITVNKVGPVIKTRESVTLDGPGFRPKVSYGLETPREILVSYTISLKESEFQKAGILKPGARVSIRGRITNVSANGEGTDPLLGVYVLVEDATFE